MRNFFLTIFVVIHIFANTVAADMKISPKLLDVEKHHFAMLLLSASYYCAKKNWPSDLQTLYSYFKENKISIGFKANWARLLSSEFEYIRSENYQLVSKGVYDGESFTLVSSQKKPTCGFFEISQNGVSFKRK